MATATRTSILLVDDDLRFRETLTDVMALENIKVEGVTTCAEALARLQTRPPLLVLLDVQLPDMSGLEFCRTLKRSKTFNHIPVVLLSAKYTEASSRAEGLLMGADAYLSKPIDPMALRKWFDVLLDNSR